MTQGKKKSKKEKRAYRFKCYGREVNLLIEMTEVQKQQQRVPFQASSTSLGGKGEMNAVFMRQSKCQDKTPLKLSIGDPTLDGNLPTSDTAVQSMQRQTHTPTNYAYQRAWGTPTACAAVAEYWRRRFATENPDACKGENVVLTTGGAEAIVNVITSLCDEGDNLLIPVPGFPAYAFTCDTFSIEKKYYHLDPEANWEVNLEEIRQLVDSRTKALVLNNPSNPCGSNWSRAHVVAIVKLCEELKLPIIADEIYCGMVYESQTFTSVAQLKTPVPRFILCGLAKNFMVPGWRLGWVLLVDPNGYAQDVLKGIQNLSMQSIGPNAITQHALPSILKDTPVSYYAASMREIEANARYFAQELKRCHGLSCSEPQGALYIMVKVHLDQFEDFADDVAFYTALEDEENIQVVPGTYLFVPGFFRVCITRDSSVIKEVMERLPGFCERHKRKQ